VGALFPDTPGLGEPFAVVLALKADVEDLSAVLVSPRGRRLLRARFFTLETDPDSGAVLKAALLAVPTLAAVGEGRVIIEGLPETAEPPGASSGETSLPNGTLSASGTVPSTGGASPESGTSPAPGEPPPAARGPVYRGAALSGEGLPILIKDRNFPAETIALNQRNTSIRTDASPQRNIQAEELQAILQHTGGEVYAADAFIPPVGSTRRTSPFGSRRIYRYVTGATDTSVHAGIDYGVPRGTQVIVCAPGKVVLARERNVTGNSVIIEHYPGVYSLYYHLDSIALEEGALVNAGDLVGESGATGLATGPHLHWEIRAAGENADPDTFTARPLLDREAIYGVLSW
jgi:murein DD-endopeptidase MepM/ murein hydrolase activator NlpD